MFVSRSYTAHNDADYKCIVLRFKEEGATFLKTIGKCDYFKTYIGTIYEIYRKF